MNNRPIVWTVAGSDSGGGAGVQADLRALDVFDVHGCSAVAAITAQNSVSVQRIDAIAPDLLDAQLTALAEDMLPAAIKTGMLGSAANLRVLAAWIDRLRQRNPALAVVVDPVLRASTGAALADEELLRAYRQELLPRSTIATPNRAEAAALLGTEPLRIRMDVEQAAKALREMGCGAVAITGGDATGDLSEDYASTAHATGWLALPRVATPHNHGTGCVFASSTAAAMARGFVAIEALVLAKMATTQALRDGCAAGSGAGPVRPRAGFALDSDHLPSFSIPGRQDASMAFPPLANPDLGLYAIVDDATWVRRVLDAGVRTVQLRVKDPRRPNLRNEVRKSVEAARAAGAQLFINDHWQLAIDEGAYGVHLGQEDLATADLAAIARAGLRLGISTHAYWEVCRAWSLKPSYIACGPIHATQAKAMPWIPQGSGNLAYWCRLLPIPVVGIGGMDVERVAKASQCGCAGVAVISAITAASSPESAIEVLKRAIDRPVGETVFNPPAALPQSTLSL
jgi:hydroxymethylpyrimidine kinase / phosphomethylpyrimidine kinase / thiamine-phosphate diphosphorylase